ncbi:hypothetical protein GCM10010094_24180 [Streptomyces flaveus]|uniref:Uncharacterized protein n=1 Tax=Streptomyces flaveus TaxID=66370 RepID=A0A917QQU4_9ACTN|nr:hypothetical protein GCM10010094_24180 [Streptomyces flaveus]
MEEHLAGVDGVETGGVPVVVGLAGPCPSVRSGAVDSGTMKPPPTAIAGSYGFVIGVAVATARPASEPPSQGPLLRTDVNCRAKYGSWRGWCRTGP